MSSITRFAAIGIAGLGIATGAAAATAATLPAFPTFSGPPSKHNPEVKPGEIIYSGDGSQFFASRGKRPGNLHWTVWNATEGRGTGAQWIDNCDPSCANGKFTLYPITLKVSAPKQESKYFIFTRLTVTYTGKKPGHKKSFTWPVSYSHGFFEIG